MPTLEQEASKLASAIYQAARPLEDLEMQGLVLGNGHHMRQQIAKFATDLLRERWQEPKAAPTPSFSSVNQPVP
jgi:hypothetical protein